MSLNQSSYCVQEDVRRLYGMRDIIVYASSHPSDQGSCLADPLESTWPSVKKMFAIGARDSSDSEFTAFYENVHDTIVSAIEATLPDADWGLNVLRLGFDRQRSKNPITVQLVVASDGGLTNDKACKIVSDISTILAAVPALSQSIHIDVCRAEDAVKSSLSQAGTGLSLLDRNPEVYDSSARLPYSSIGPVGYDRIGTLSGYIKHRDKDGREKVYALTCRHVVDPPNAPKFLSVASPAACDHNQTIEQIRFDISMKTGRLQDKIIPLEHALEKALAYNITFGNVLATSGTNRLLPNFKGRSDWAIISTTNNDHVRSSDGFDSFYHPEIAPLDINFLRAALNYFDPGPHFKPVRDGDLSPDEVVFKPRSRTINEWVGGTFNGIRSTQKEAGWVTRECCLVALFSEKVMSARGDSGSIIVDREFRPVAMMWGGDKHWFAHGPRDLTYASPLAKVMKDIEDRIGGSVSIV